MMRYLSEVGLYSRSRQPFELVFDQARDRRFGTQNRARARDTNRRVVRSPTKNRQLLARVRGRIARKRVAVQRHQRNRIARANAPVFKSKQRDGLALLKRDVRSAVRLKRK